MELCKKRKRRKMKMKLKKTIKQIIKFCSDSIFITEGEMLYEMLQKQLKETQRENKRKLIGEVIMPNIQAAYMKDTNLLMPERQLRELATDVFNVAKANGRIDCYNSLIAEGANNGL